MPNEFLFIASGYHYRDKWSYSFWLTLIGRQRRLGAMVW